jgi:hypothetical protein
VAYFEEQLEQEWAEAPQDEHDDLLPVPPSPDHENVLMSLRVRSLAHFGQATGPVRPPRTISSNLSPHDSHWNSYIGIQAPIRPLG